MPRALRSLLLPLLLVVPLAEAAGAPEIDPLAARWLSDPVRARLLTARQKSAVAGATAASARAAVAGISTPEAIAVRDLEVLPQSPGDKLLITKDDGFATTPVFENEGRLSPSPVGAGTNDWLAFRFSTQELAKDGADTIKVTGVTLGFDNVFGRRSWPKIGISREDPAAPLNPALPPIDSVTGFDPTAQLPAPAVAGTPDVFKRIPVAFPAGALLSLTPIDDGMWSDNFDRATNELLDKNGSDWLECDLTTCGFLDAAKKLEVRSNQASKRLTGTTLGVKYPASVVLARRPVTDLDVILAVDYDVSAAGAGRAGVAFRIQNLQQFYAAVYDKPSNTVQLYAQTPGGLMPLLAPPMALSSSKPRARLTVTVRGPWSANGNQIDLMVDGPTIDRKSFNDTTYQYSGVLSGLFADGATTGETWNNFTVARNPDVFAVVQFPAGANAALPGERSPSAVGFANVLASSDGKVFSLVGTESGCAQPPSGFASLEVSDTIAGSHLFQVESKLASLAIDCPTCPSTRYPCVPDLGPNDRNQPVFETGKTVNVNLGWWNEHLSDVTGFMPRVLIYQNSCAEPLSTLVTQNTVSPFADSGQPTAGAVFRTLVAPALSYTPTAPGVYCAVALEYYDLNNDRCPDGWERAQAGDPCPPGCTCVKDPDENAATGVVTREFRVYDPCAPLPVSEMVRNSLRAGKDAADPTAVDFSWNTSGTLARLYNVHLTERKSELADPTIRTVVIPFVRLLGNVPLTRTVQVLPAPVTGNIDYVAVFQADGCISAWSLADP